MNFMKTLIAILIIISVIIPAGVADDVNLLYGDMTIGYVAAANAGLNPFICSERDMVSINSLVYESLFELDSSLQPRPLLAENWTQDGKNWTIKLRSGIICHNGIELVAQDVVDSFNALRSAGANTPYFGRLSFINSMVAIDAFTLAVDAAYTGMITLYALTFPVAQRGSITNDLPTGTGPYWYITYSMNNAIRLEMNPLWWKKAPTISSIVFRHYWDTAGLLAALQSGEIDMFQTRSASAALTKKLSYASSMDYATTTYEMLVPNMSGYLSDARVRKAIMYSIDYTSIISNAYLDMAQQCEVPIPPGSWLYESRSAVYYYSPERAIQLLNEAGWYDLTGDFWLNKVEGGMLKYLEINILVYDDQSTNVRGNAANTIAANLRAIGIKSTVTKLSASEARREINKRNFQLALVGLHLSELPNMIPLLSETGNCNLSNVYSKEWNQLLGATATAATEADLISAYSALQLKIVDELPFMGLCFRTGMVLSTRPLTGFTPSRETDAFSGMEFAK